MELDRATRPREEVEGEESEYEYAIFPDGTWCLVPKGSVKYIPIPTPVSTPAPTPSTPAHTPTTQMPKPLLTTHTPIPTPTPTPVASPKKGAVPKQPKPQREPKPKDPKEKEESDPGIFLVVRSDIVLQTINNQQMIKEATNGKIVKYAITNTSCQAEMIKSPSKIGEI